MIVSIIIPTYNRSHLITHSIESILRQTYKEYEIIVIDDGSTDDTETQLKKYSDQIKYIKQKNRGAGAARNQGLFEAKGKYIAFLDSDDLWVEHKLELQVEIMEKLPELGFLSTEFCVERGSGEKIHSALRTWHKTWRQWEDYYERRVSYASLGPSTLPPSEDFSIYIGNIYYPLLKEPLVLPSSAIVRRTCLAPETKFTEGVPLYEDWDFFALLSRDNTSAFLDIETTTNRGHHDDVRLTCANPQIKAENRLASISRVWKSDQEFASKHIEDINRAEGEQLIILAKLFLLNSRPQKAFDILKQWDALAISTGGSYVYFLKTLSKMPGSGKLLYWLRNFRQFFSHL